MTSVSQEAKKPSSEAATIKFSITFENDQNQPDISKADKSLLPVMLKNVGQGYSVDDADDDLTYNSGLDGGRGDPSCKGKEEEERNENEDFDNCNYRSVRK